MTLGLRIDVDTFRGTRDGVPALCRLMARRGLRASFFFCVGPDNMGRRLLRFWRPRFAAKMWRSRARRLYGWSILSRGLLGNGPLIGKRLGQVIRDCLAEGHEVGLHAWDHSGWQSHALKSSGARFLRDDLRRGFEELERVTGHPPDCSAAPAWLCTPESLLLKETFPFRFNSDCRGTFVFRPALPDGRLLSQPQAPTTLPVYDEVIGIDGLADSDYNDYLVSRLRPGRLNVLTAHAEVEGICKLELFEDFLDRMATLGWTIEPLGVVVGPMTDLPAARVELRALRGRDDVVAFQV